MNTSMTINATCGLVAGFVPPRTPRTGAVPVAALSRTTQNDIDQGVPEPSTFIFPPGPGLRLTVDTIAYPPCATPKWNPINVCSYHLQEAGDAGAGGGLRAGHGDRRPRRRATFGKN